MRALIKNFVRDEHGAIISAELIIIATVVVLALVVGWNAVAASLVGELTDIAGAFGSLNQSYNYRGISAQGHAHCSGSGFNDSGSTFNLTSNSGGTSGGGGGGSSNSIAGGGQAAGASGVASFAAPQTAFAPSVALAVPQLATAPEFGIEEIVTIDEGVSLNEANELLALEEVITTLKSQLVDVQQNATVTRAASANPTCAEDLAHLKRRIYELCAEVKRLEAKSSQPLRPIPEAAPKSLSQPVKPKAPAN